MSEKNVIVGIVLLLIGGFTLSYLRKKSLNNDGVKTVCKITEFRTIGRGARTLDSKAAYYIYLVNGVEYKDYNDAYPPEVSINKCYEVTYLPYAPHKNKINFKIQVDCSNYKGK
jgi:asparagine N-glycosylation enzyme membrane subunit Stt3